jgi:SAM-dependent methyltransferase
MGLSKAALHFLAIQHRQRPFTGKGLTLGRQCVYATHEEVQEILREHSLEPAPLPAGMLTRTNVPGWMGTPRESNTSDVAFFHQLGVSSLHAMDVEPFEGAEVIWDLNQPIPERLRAQFDFVIDSGTLEHVFDVRTALRNVVNLLRPGGRIVHLSPANNHCNHGFFQFSPTLFADFYEANRFSAVQVWVAEESLSHEETASLEFFRFDRASQPCRITSPANRRLQAICVAEKGEASTDDAIPLQSYYSTLFARGELTAESRAAAEAAHVPRGKAAALLKRWLPFSVYQRFRGAWIRLRGSTETRKPLGMTFWRRLP